MTALWGLLRKETYHILRDRRTLAVLVMLPVVQVILFGASIRTDVKAVRLAIVDPLPDAATLALRSRFLATGLFRVVAVLPSDRELDRLFRSNAAQIAVDFQPGFAERLARGEAARLLVISDATEPNTGVARQSYLSAVVQQYAAEGAPAPGAAPSVRIEMEVRARFNPTRESANLFVPGLMAMVLTIISALMTALSLTREKETGTLEALLVSPLRPWQIIVGKVVPYLVIGFVSVVLVLVEARLVFRVPMRGSVALLLVEGVLFILVALALGILISARASSQRVAMLAAMMATMLPTQILSGFIFPLESLPRPLQWLANVIPAKWFVIIARGIMLEGIGLEYLWPQTLVLAFMALALMVAASRSFGARLQ